MQTTSRIRTPLNLMLTALFLLALSGCSQDSHTERSDEPSAETPQTLAQDEKGSSKTPDGVLKDRGVQRLAWERCTGNIARTEKTAEIIEDAASYQQALNEVHARTSEPVDFDNYVVVAAYGGLQSDCGNEVLIFGPTADKAGNHVIEYGVTETEYTCTHRTVEDSESYPYAFAKFPRLEEGSSYTLKERTIPSCLK